jgi:hypothetical protein
MFFKKIKKNLQELQEKIDTLARHTIRDDDLVSCESCGCLLYKNKAVAGEAEIRKADSIWFSGFQVCHHHSEKYIYTPYYCRFCAPEKG